MADINPLTVVSIVTAAIFVIALGIGSLMFTISCWVRTWRARNTRDSGLLAWPVLDEERAP